MVRLVVGVPAECRDHLQPVDQMRDTGKEGSTRSNKRRKDGNTRADMSIGNLYIPAALAPKLSANQRLSSSTARSNINNEHIILLPTLLPEYLAV